MAPIAQPYSQDSWGIGSGPFAALVWVEDRFGSDFVELHCLHQINSTPTLLSCPSPQITPLSPVLLPKLSPLLDYCLGWAAQSSRASCLSLSTHQHPIIAIKSSTSKHRHGHHHIVDDVDAIIILDTAVVTSAVILITITFDNISIVIVSGDDAITFAVGVVIDNDVNILTDVIVIIVLFVMLPGGQSKISLAFSIPAPCTHHCCLNCRRHHLCSCHSCHHHHRWRCRRWHQWWRWRQRRQRVFAITVLSA